MTGQEHAKKRRVRRNARGLYITLIAVAVLLVAALGFGIFANNVRGAYPNTFVGEVAVSGKTEDEICALLDEESAQKYSAVSFDITVGDVTRTLLASDLNVKVDSKAAAERALARGRGGNAFTRPLHYLGALFHREVIDTPVMLDDELLTHLAEEFAKADIAPVDAAYREEGDTLILTPPVDGKKLDQEEFMATIREKFATFSYDNVTIEPKVAEAKPLDLDAVYAEVHKEVSDAKLETVDGKSKVTPHVVGVDFDLAAAKSALVQSPDREVRVALTLTQPKITTLMVQSTLFQDTLSQKTTYFSPKKVNRVSNVKLAAKNINGTILNPGEVFSFNKTVGPRTAARGFKEAQIFASGEIVDGLGGGICQVSSTLYMASMYADLKTVSRRNHSFYVDYAPKGQDATVVYGSIDFQFENSTPYPIKIVAYAENSFVRVTIKGTKTQQKSVKIKTSTLSTTPYQTKTVVDSSLKAGERVVKQKGQEGITMEAYRYVYDANGNLLSKSFENKTKYVPLTEIVHVGSGTAPASGTNDGTVNPPASNPPASDPPKQEPPKQDPPKQDPPASDPPKQDPPTSDPSKDDPPKEDPSKQDPSKQEDPPEEQPADNSGTGQPSEPAGNETTA